MGELVLVYDVLSNNKSSKPRAFLEEQMELINITSTMTTTMMTTTMTMIMMIKIKVVTTTIKQKYQAMIHHMMILISVMAIWRITDKIIMTPQKTGIIILKLRNLKMIMIDRIMVPTLRNLKMITLMDL